MNAFFELIFNLFSFLLLKILISLAILSHSYFKFASNLNSRVNLQYVPFFNHLHISSKNNPLSIPITKSYLKILSYFHLFPLPCPYHLIFSSFSHISNAIPINIRVFCFRT